MNNYEKFYQLHHAKDPLIIGNIWNPRSAKILELNGFKALATSSAAVANSLGYEDGENIPFDELLFIVKRIVKGISVPLSVDMESGYGKSLKEIISNIDQLVAIGVAGINIEDSTGDGMQPVELLAEKVKAIKQHLADTNRQLFINARTDGFLKGLADAEKITLERIPVYEKAGADGIFVPFLKELHIINKITAFTKLPVNLLCVPELNNIEQITSAGVRRISLGSYLFKATYNFTDQLSKKFIAEGSFEKLF